GESRSRIDAGVPELVVGSTFLRFGEDLVGFLGLLEIVLGSLVVRISVRMMLHRELPIGLLDLLIGSIAIDAQHRIVVALCHRIRQSRVSGAVPVGTQTMNVNRYERSTTIARQARARCRAGLQQCRLL